MKACKYFDICLGFNTEINLNRPMSIIKYYHRKYCENKPTKCARYIVMEELDKSYLPDDLLPYEMDKAKKLINNN